MPPVDFLFFWLLSGEGSKRIFTGSNQESIRPLANSAPDLIRSGSGKRQVLKMIKFWRECLLSHEIIVTAGRTLEYNPHFGVG